MQKTPAERSLIAQILDELTRRLENDETFDAESVRRLRCLAANGDLDKPDRVKKAIEPTTEG